MGWVMLFWVVVIVGVPTALWFLLSEPGQSSRLPGDDRDGNPLGRTPGEEVDQKKGDDADVAILRR